MLYAVSFCWTCIVCHNREQLPIHVAMVKWMLQRLQSVSLFASDICVNYEAAVIAVKAETAVLPEGKLQWYIVQL